MNVKQEIEDIISTCENIEQLRYIKVRYIRVNHELYRALCMRLYDNVNFVYGFPKSRISINMFYGTKVKVERHKMKTPWMLVVTPVNNKGDRIYR